MRMEQCFAHVLLLMVLALHVASGVPPPNQHLVDATEAYVWAFKVRLSEDTYYLVEDPAFHGHAEEAFDQANGASWRFRFFFTTITPTEYPALDEQRRTMLDAILDFLNSSETDLKDLHFPFGQKQCQLVPNEFHPKAWDARVVLRIRSLQKPFDLSTLVGNITEHVDRLRGQLDNGTFKAGFDKVRGIKKTCKGYNFYASLEENIVRGCEEADAAKCLCSCLQVLVARHTNYSAGAMETFKRSLGKYIHLKAFCFTFTDPASVDGDAEAANATIQFLYKLRAGMKLVDKIPMNNTGPWTCNDTLLPQPPTALPTVLTQETRTLVTGTPPRPLTTGLTPLPKKAAVQESVIRGVAEGVVRKLKPKLDATGWSGRYGLHQQIAYETVLPLTINYTDFFFNTIAFLPFDRKDQKCIYNESAFISAGYRNLNFFVRYVEKGKESAMETAMRVIQDKKNTVLNQVFGEGYANLCDRLKTAIDDPKGNVDKFGGIVAVKCGYEFVWYEVAYMYFHAAASSSMDAWETNSGSYGANCGQIFFFP